MGHVKVSPLLCKLMNRKNPHFRKRERPIGAVGRAENTLTPKTIYTALKFKIFQNVLRSRFKIGIFIMLSGLSARLSPSLGC